MNLSRDQIHSISRQVYHKFPELDGATPKVKSQRYPTNDSKHETQSRTLASQRYLLTYKGKASMPGGRTMMRIVRVVSNGQGDLLKITTSK